MGVIPFTPEFTLKPSPLRCKRPLRISALTLPSGPKPTGIMVSRFYVTGGADWAAPVKFGAGRVGGPPARQILPLAPQGRMPRFLMPSCVGMIR
jgi:hypothetical protein